MPHVHLREVRGWKTHVVALFQTVLQASWAPVTNHVVVLQMSCGLERPPNPYPVRELRECRASGSVPCFLSG